MPAILPHNHFRLKSRILGETTNTTLYKKEGLGPPPKLRIERCEAFYRLRCEASI